MPYKKYALALICCTSLTGCWPVSEQPQEQAAPQTKKATGSVRYIKTESDFTQVIKQGNVVVDFYADWCGPCKRLGPVLDELAKELTNITFVKVNIDNVSSVSDRYSVRSIPTLILFKDGKQIKRISGYQSKTELRSTLKSAF